MRVERELQKSSALRHNNFHIDFYDLVLVVTITTGLNFAWLLVYTKRSSQPANWYLALVLAVASLWLIRSLGIDMGLHSPFPLNYSLALGPLLYFYVQRLTKQVATFRGRDWLHFSPLILELFFARFDTIVYLLTVISVVAYVFAAHRLIERFYARQQYNEWADRQRDELKWLQGLLNSFGAVWLLWIPVAAASYYFHWGIQASYPLTMLSMAMLIRFAMAAMSRTEFGKPVAVAMLSTPSAELKQKAAWLKNAVTSQKLYEDPDLALSTLAEKLAMNPHELSRMVNMGLKKSFADFINEFRIREVVRKMQHPNYDTWTLLGIAYDSGFNSKTNFNRAFKQTTGKSPAAYKAELKKLRPFYNTEPHLRGRPLILHQGIATTWSREKSNRKVMFKNYLKIATRNLVKGKAQSLINISGLAIGFAVALLAALWVWDELSFDTCNANYASIVQIARKEITKGDVNISDGSNHFPIPLAAELRTNYNNVFRQVSLITEKGGHILSADNNNKHTLQGMFVEKSFLDIFTLRLTAGTQAGFADPHSVLISRSAAETLFGGNAALGKVIKLDNTQPLTIIGIYDDLPVNSSFAGTSFFCPFDLLSSIDPGMKARLTDWNNSSFFIFANLQPGITPDQASATVKEVYWNRIKNSPNLAPGYKAELFMHPMKDWHLRSEWKNGRQSGGRIQVVRLFSLIGLFVLLLACINFINLSTARSGKRAKEIGIRKTMGSGRGQLILQFMGEVFLTVVIAAVLGIVLVLCSLPSFDQVAGKAIAFPWDSGWFWLGATVLVLVTTLISGSYPALYLSSFNPIKVLKGAVKAGKYVALPRKALLTVQFVVSIVLIIGTIVVYRQIRLAQERPIGYDRQGLIRFTMTTTDLKGKFEVLQTALLASNGASNVAESSSSATGDNYFDDHFDWLGKDQAPHNQAFALMAVTPEYAQTVHWQFVAGRNFIRGQASDNTGVILNEAAVKYTGLKNPVGQLLRWNGRPFTIVGVIRDMVKNSPYQPAGQSLYFNAPDIGPEITIRLNPALSASQALAKIEPVFRQLNPSAPFDYTFIDDEYAQKFASEQRIGTLSELFAALAVFISCLGVFGLASFIAEQRIKEIGIRKVLGASSYSIWQLFSREFAIIILLAVLIATPLAYYGLHQWLEGYQYRTSLAWWIFFAGGLGVLVITLLTASYHALRAARANPVKSLRVE